MEQEANRHKPYLDKDLKEIEKIDNKIEWFQSKITDLEKEKQNKLANLAETFDTAMVTRHSLKNGYTALIDNRYEIKIDDTAAFLKWLKANCTPDEVLEFFTSSLKITSLKKFCSVQINKRVMQGMFESEIQIDGITIKDMQYRRLTTKKGKQK